MSNDPSTSQEVYTMAKENIWSVIDRFLSACKVDPRNEIPMDFVMDKFYTKFPQNFDGSISIKACDLFNFINDINNEAVDIALKKLIKAGVVELLWDADTNDFAYRAVKGA